MVLLPLTLLLWAQMRFLRYHSEATTWSQRAAVMADLVMLWLFLPMIVTPSHDARDWWKQIIPGLIEFGKRWGPRATKLWKQIIPDAIQLVIRFWLYILVEPLPPVQRETKQTTEDFECLGKEPAGRARGVLVLTFASLVAALFPLFNAPGLSFLGISFPRGLQLAEKTLVAASAWAL
jgi:hypothetical protein